MTQIIDTRGLSCPQPVMLVLSKLRELRCGEITVLIDTATTRENVVRAAESCGWVVSETELANDDELRLQKS